MGNFIAPGVAKAMSFTETNFELVSMHSASKMCLVGSTPARSTSKNCVVPAPAGRADAPFHSSFFNCLLLPEENSRDLREQVPSKGLCASFFTKHLPPFPQVTMTSA